MVRTLRWILTNICWAAAMISCWDFLWRQLMMSVPVSVVHSSLVASSLLASSGEFCMYWSHRAVPSNQLQSGVERN